VISAAQAVRNTLSKLKSNGISGLALAATASGAVAPPDIAQRILQRLQQLSAPLGTRIDIAGNVGYIRL